MSLLHAIDLHPLDTACWDDPIAIRVTATAWSMERLVDGFHRLNAAEHDFYPRIRAIDQHGRRCSVDLISGQVIYD